MQLYKRMSAQVLASQWPCDLEWTYMTFKLQSNSRIFQYLASYQVWKKSGSQVSWHMTMFDVYAKKITSAEFSPLNTTCQRKFEYEFQQTNRLWQHTEFHPNQYLILPKWTPTFWFLIQLWAWMKVKVIETDIKMQSLVVSIIISSLKQTGQ